MNHDRQKREEIVPVAVTLRNAYAPYQQKSRDFKSSINGHDDHEHDNDNDHEQERCPISVFVAPNPNPIEMELVAPYSLLVQLKHSYKNDEVIKNKISAQFGLGKMEHENSGKNDADVNRFIPICSKNTWEWECNCECDCEYEYGGNMGLGAEFGMHSNGSCTIESELESNHQLQHQQQQKQASHPLWDHVNERLDDLHETLVTLPNKHHSDCDFEGNDNDNSEVTRRDTKLRERIWDDIRNHVRIQCKVHVHAIIPTSDDDPSTSNTNTNTNTNLILASVPLNLRRLVQLPVNQLDDHTSAMSVSDEEPKILGVSKYNNSIPHSLPRNSILVHFSDGSTRVSPSLYDLLVKRNVIVDVPISIGSGGDGNANASTSASTSTSTNLDIDVDKFERRFEDDIFNVLGDVKSKSPTTRMRNGIGNGNDGNGQIHGHNSHGHEGINNGHPDQYKKVKLKFNNASSIQDTSSNSSHSHRHLNSDQTKTLNGNGNGNGNGSSISPRQNGIQHGNASKGSMRGSFADAFESLAISPAPVKGVHTKAASQTNNEEVLMTSMELSDDEDSESAEDLMIHSNNTTLHSADCETSSSIIASNHNMCTTRYNEANNSCSEVVTSEDIVNRIQDLDDEMELLQRVLDLEETVLNSEDEEQQTDVQWLETFVTEVLDLEDEIIEITEETVLAKESAKDLKERLISRRVKILKELRQNIFPIGKHDAFTIHGIHLPKDLHSLSAYDEIISAGLGFVCLLVMMCSKYLAIPLRHRLIFNSSRSAVRDYDFDIFPLFKERVVEKEQFDRAIILLNRNIDHLMESQGMDATNNTEHMLVKLELLLDHIT